MCIVFSVLGFLILIGGTILALWLSGVFTKEESPKLETKPIKPAVQAVPQPMVRPKPVAPSRPTKQIRKPLSTLECAMKWCAENKLLVSAIAVFGIISLVYLSVDTRPKNQIKWQNKKVVVESNGFLGRGKPKIRNTDVKVVPKKKVRVEVPEKKVVNVPKEEVRSQNEPATFGIPDPHPAPNDDPELNFRKEKGFKMTGAHEKGDYSGAEKDAQGYFVRAKDAFDNAGGLRSREEYKDECKNVGGSLVQCGTPYGYQYHIEHEHDKGGKWGYDVDANGLTKGFHTMRHSFNGSNVLSPGNCELSCTETSECGEGMICCRGHGMCLDAKTRSSNGPACSAYRAKHPDVEITGAYTPLLNGHGNYTSDGDATSVYSGDIPMELWEE